MIENFEKCLPLLLRHEGGYVNHPRDPGGHTNLGVTLHSWQFWMQRPVTVEELKALTPKDVTSFYRVKYWNEVRGDALPAGVDYCLFDFGVNSGPKRAVVAVQEVLRVNPDGLLGPVTLSAIEKADPLALIDGVCQYRLAFLEKLPHWDTFGTGWSRRVADVRRDAKDMANGTL